MASPGPFNPYAPPGDMGAPGSPMGFEGFGVWQQDGKAVLYANSGRLPNRCASCNGPGQHRVHKTFYWHEPWLYVLILGGVLIYAIVAQFARKSASVEYWLCDEHRKKRTLGLVLAWVGFLVGFVLMFVAAGAGSGALLGLAFLGMFVPPIVGGLMARMVNAKRITDVEVWLEAGAPFVASLPASPRMGQIGPYGGYGGQPGPMMGQGYQPPPRW